MNYIEMVNDSLEYLETKLQRPVTLDELAEKYYISRYHFYRIFRAITNMTLKEYTLRRRLSEAAKQIKSTPKNIIDIGFEFGFESLYLILGPFCVILQRYIYLDFDGRVSSATGTIYANCH
jgi:AraC family transcriptional regulator